MQQKRRNEFQYHKSLKREKESEEFLKVIRKYFVFSIKFLLFFLFLKGIDLISIIFLKTQTTHKYRFNNSKFNFAQKLLRIQFKFSTFFQKNSSSRTFQLKYLQIIFILHNVKTFLNILYEVRSKNHCLQQ